MVMDAAPDWLREALVTLAWCWRLSRRDGVVVGLTSHDRDLTVGGISYRSPPRMKPSAVETSAATQHQAPAQEGAITSDAIAAPALADTGTGSWWRRVGQYG